MTIKNFTTKIKIEKTIGEIEILLAKFGASHIFKMYEDGIPKGIAFTLIVQDNPITFKLPMKEKSVIFVFNQEVSKRKLPEKYRNNIEQARRTGWRIIKDWIDSQLALIEIEVAKPEEIFLSYMYDVKTNQTLFEKMSNEGFNNILEDKR